MPSTNPTTPDPKSRNDRPFTNPHPTGFTNPTTWAGTTPASLAATLKPYGLAPAQVWGTDPETGESRNRRGYLRDAVTTAWLATRKDRAGTDRPDHSEGDSA